MELMGFAELGDFFMSDPSHITHSYMFHCENKRNSGCFVTFQPLTILLNKDLHVLQQYYLFLYYFH